MPDPAQTCVLAGSAVPVSRLSLGTTTLGTAALGTAALGNPSAPVTEPADA